MKIEQLLAKIEQLTELVRVPVVDVPGCPAAAGWDRVLAWAKMHHAEIKPDYADRPSFNIADAVRVGQAEAEYLKRYAAEVAAKQAAEHEAYLARSDAEMKASVVNSPEWNARRAAEQKGREGLLHRVVNGAGFTFGGGS